MIFDKYFMVIPVYRLSEEKYYLECEKNFEKLVSSSWEKSFRESNPDMVESWKKNQRIIYGGDWEFNEIIGYIKLFFMGSQVRGEYWSTAPNRKVRTRKKQYEFKANKLVSEGHIRKRTSEGVLSAIEEYIARCKIKLKRRHIDLREFEALRKHIDWFSIYTERNVFKENMQQSEKAVSVQVKKKK